MNEYPLTDEDLQEIGRRMARGETCYIPIRRDIYLADGRIENCLTWGSPVCYYVAKVPQVRGSQSLYLQGGITTLYYGRMKEGGS